MPAGKSWTLTKIRKEKVIELLRQQMTIAGIASYYGVGPATLARHIKKHELDWREIKLSGIDQLRSKMYRMIDNINEPEKAFNAGMKFLSTYDRETLTKSVETTEEVVSQISFVRLKPNE